MKTLTPTFQNAVIAATIFIVLASSFVIASAADDYAAKFITADEKGIANVSSFTSGGLAFYMLTVGGKESIVFKANSNGSFSPVTSETDLVPILKDYISSKFGSYLSSDQIAKIVSDYTLAQNQSDVCTHQTTELLKASGSLNLMIIALDAGSPTRPLEATVNGLIGHDKGNKAVPVTGVDNMAAIILRAGDIKGSNGTQAVVKGGMLTIGDMVNSLPSETPMEQAQTVASAKLLISQLKPVITKYKTQYSYICTRLPGALRDYGCNHVAPKMMNCTFSADSLSSLEGSLGVGKVVPSESDMATQVANSTASRKEIFNVDSIASEVAHAAAPLFASSAALRVKLTAAGIDTSALDAKVSDLNQSAATVSLATSQSDAEAAKAMFLSKLNATQSYVNVLQSDNVFSALNESNFYLNNAQIAIDLANSRVEQGNPQVEEMQTSFSTLQIELTQARSDIAKGDFEGKVATIQNITSDLKALQANAEAVKPKSEEQDMLLYGGAIILILLVAAVFYYYKNKKPPGVVRPAINPASGIIISKPMQQK